MRSAVVVWMLLGICAPPAAHLDDRDILEVADVRKRDLLHASPFSDSRTVECPYKYRTFGLLLKPVNGQ